MNNKNIYFLTIITIFVCILFFYKDLFLSVFFSYFLYLTLIPVKIVFIRSSIIKKFFIILLFFIFFIFLFYNTLSIIFLFQDYLPTLLENTPMLTNKFLTFIDDLKNKFPILTFLSVDNNMIVQGTYYFKNLGLTFLSSLPKFLQHVTSLCIFIPLFLIFFLKDSLALKKEIYKIIPNKFFEQSTYFISFFHKNFSKYMASKFLEACCIFLLLIIFIGHLPQGLFLSYFPAFVSFIPYLGPLIGFIPAVFFFSFDILSYDQFQYYIMFYIIVQLIDFLLIFPFLVSQSVRINPLYMFISLYIGSQMMGILGMMISIPVAAFFKLLYEHVYREIYERY